MEIEIREYRATDLSAGRDLWRQLTQRHRDIYDDQSIGGDDPGLQFDDYLATDELAGPWVAVVDGEIVGLAGLLVAGAEGEVEPIVVEEAKRSQGIGAELLEHVKRQARARGVDFLSIRPVARNIAAISHFHRSGFTRLGHIDMFLRLGADDRPWNDGIEIHGSPFRY